MNGKSEQTKPKEFTPFLISTDQVFQNFIFQDQNSHVIWGTFRVPEPGYKPVILSISVQSSWIIDRTLRRIGESKMLNFEASIRDNFIFIAIDDKLFQNLAGRPEGIFRLSKNQGLKVWLRDRSAQRYTFDAEIDTLFTTNRVQPKYIYMNDRVAISVQARTGKKLIIPNLGKGLPITQMGYSGFGILQGLWPELDLRSNYVNGKTTISWNLEHDFDSDFVQLERDAGSNKVTCIPCGKYCEALPTLQANKPVKDDDEDRQPESLNPSPDAPEDEKDDGQMAFNIK